MEALVRLLLVPLVGLSFPIGAVLLLAIAVMVLKLSLWRLVPRLAELTTTVLLVAVEAFGRALLLFEYGVTSLLRRLNRRPPSAAYRYGGWVASAAGGLQTALRGVFGWVGRPRRLSGWWALGVALFALALWVERPCLPEGGAARSVDRLTSGWFSVASWVNEGPVRVGRSSPAGIQPLFCSTRQAPGRRPPTHRKAVPPKTRRS